MVEKLIVKYIDDNFMLGLENSVIIKYKGGDEIKIDDLNNEIKVLFNVDTKLIMDITKEWFNFNLNELTIDLMDYLNNYEVIIGETNWLVKHKITKDIFDIDKMCNIFNKKYSEKFIKIMHNHWFIESICTKSEDILKMKIR